MKRYIINYKHKTLFYFKQEDKKLLWEELKKHTSLKDYKLIWYIDHFTLGKPILKSASSEILEVFRNTSNTIITGYQGCLITGYNFSWKYE